MSGLKTLLCSTALAVTSSLPPAQAKAVTLPDEVTTFATCAGRLSAVMEFQWMFDGPASEVTEAQRAAMLSLLAAVQPDGAGRDILHMRIEAKMAQAALLTRATFGQKERDATRAMRLAEVQRSACTALLLS